jgi:hypothetical protein
MVCANNIPLPGGSLSQLHYPTMVQAIMDELETCCATPSFRMQLDSQKIDANRHKSALT